MDRYALTTDTLPPRPRPRPANGSCRTGSPEDPRPRLGDWWIGCAPCGAPGATAGGWATSSTPGRSGCATPAGGSCA